MEREIEEEFFSTPAKAFEAWIRFLEAHGAVTPLSGPDDPCKVIAISERLWELGRLAERSLSHSAADPTGSGSRQSIYGRSTSENPPRPAEFLDELKRQHFRERATTIQIGNLSVPIELRHIVDRIRQSRSILQSSQADLSDDDETHGVETWRRAAQFVVKASTSFWKLRHSVPPTPAITAGPDGSIDVVWRLGNRALYINVPADPHNVVTFFGTDRVNVDLRLRGEVNSEDDGEWILGWLLT